MTAYSSILTDYLGQGAVASRPATLSIASTALGFYYASDTNVLYAWDTNTTAWVTAGGGSGSGTVTQIVAGTGLAGGTITTTGTVSLGAIGAGMVLANTGTSSAAPSGVSVTGLLDAEFGSTEGDILVRGSAHWQVLNPGTSGQALITQGTTAAPAWGTVSALVSGANNTMVANISGSAAVPTNESITSVLDAAFGSTQGDILYRSASAWQVLTPGTNGYVLTTGGSGANPSWAAGSGLPSGATNTVLSNISGGATTPVLNQISAVLDAAFGSSQGGVLYRGASGWSFLPASTSGYVLTTQGGSANPEWAAVTSDTGGTVTSVVAGTGLAGGTITGSGTISLGTISSGLLLANTGTAAAAPSGVSLSALLDLDVGSLQGSIAYRSGSGWVSLSPGISGDVLQTNGTLANPSWAAPSGLPAVATGTVVANISGSTTQSTSSTLSAVLDAILGSAQGNIIYRGASTWGVLAPGSSGEFLMTGGASANPSWAAAGGSGTVTSLVAGSGLAGGTITTTGTVSLSTEATNTILANISGSTAVPTGSTISAILSATIGTTQGSIIYRSGTSWLALPPGTAGQVLQTGGTGANPSWGAAGAGTVTSLVAGSGLSGGTITTTGTVALASIASGDVLANISGSAAVPTATTVTALLDSGIGSAEGDILVRGASGWTGLAPGTVGEVLVSGGSGAVPSWSTVGYSGLPTAVQQLPLGYVLPGTPSGGAVLNLVMGIACTLPANLAGTVTYDGTLPTASAIFTLKKISGGVTTSVATITLLTSGHTANTLSTQAAISLAAGDVLQLEAPATADATLADVGITVLALRT